MIKITKNLSPTDIPRSIRFPHRDFFTPFTHLTIPTNTNTKRIELIRAGSYIDTDPFNSRYKRDDVKKALIAIYKYKCAFCEQRVEQFHVEHYRPKSIYYWLAFSWDNLLCACHDCNQEKKAQFLLDGVFTSFQIKPSFFKKINTLSAYYDLTELPRLVNPEVTDPSGLLKFKKDGCISSTDLRFQYTIITCKIDRKYLNDLRKAIFEELIADLNKQFLLAKNRNELRIGLRAIVEKFTDDYLNANNEYLAFRKYVIDHWLRDEVKKVFSR